MFLLFKQISQTVGIVQWQEMTWATLENDVDNDLDLSLPLEQNQIRPGLG